MISPHLTDEELRQTERLGNLLQVMLLLSGGPRTQVAESLPSTTLDNAMYEVLLQVLYMAVLKITLCGRYYYHNSIISIS